MYAAQFLVRLFLEAFREFPAQMKPASFSIDQTLDRLEQAMHSS
jgi:hypothetical protein